MFQSPLLMLVLIVLLIATWTREGTTWTSTWSGFLDNFEVREDMTEVTREFRDQTTQISRPRIKGAERSRPSKETTHLEPQGPRIFTAATPTARLAATSMRMSPPTTTAQPHWTTPTRPTPKGKELENKPVQDQTVKDFQEKDMRDHWSGYNDEDEDQLKLDIERIDGEEGQDPNKETGQNDLPNQVSRISNNQVPGVETPHQHDDGHCQEPGVDHQVSTSRILDNNQVSGVEPQFSTHRVPGNNHSAGVEAQQPASGDGPDNCQSQVWGRQRQVPGVESQVPTTIRSANKQVPQDTTPRELDNQDNGLEAQFPAYRRNSNQEVGLKTQNSTEEKHHNQVRDGPNNWYNQFQGQHNQVLGVELQSPTTKGLHNLVPGVESQASTVQGSGPGGSKDQPPCCLTHSYKSNMDNTERLWWRKSSKDQDQPGKESNKTVWILEVMNWWRAVCELLVLATAFHVSMELGFLYNPIRKLQQQIGFPNKSPRGLKSPQASLGQMVQQQAGEENEQDTCEKPIETGRVSYVKILIILLVVLIIGITNRTTSSVDRVHQFPEKQGMITMESRIVYRRSGENLAFLNDCLATKLEAIIKELERGRQSDPKFWSLINNQRRPQNKVVIGKLKTREWSEPRLPIPPRNEQELQKGGRSSPKLLDLIRNKKRSKNGIGQELEKGSQSDPKFWSLLNQKRPQNKTIIEELETRECSDPRTSTLPRNGKELQKGDRSSPKFLYSLQHRRGF